MEEELCRQLKDFTAEKKKNDGRVKGCMDNWQVTKVKHWWIMNSHIDGYSLKTSRWKQSTIIAFQNYAVSGGGVGGGDITG